MTFSNDMAQSLGKFVFQNAVTASLPLADLNATAGSVTSLNIALHTADPGIAGSQSTSEATFTGYARQTLSRTSGNWPFTSPNIFENGATITFGPNTGTSQTVSWASVGTGVSNRMIFRTPLALETPKPFEALETTNGDISARAHGYSAGQEIVFVDVEGETLPTGITEGTTYFVIAAGLATDTFRYSITSGGSANVHSTKGAGYLAKISQKAVGTNDTVVFDTTNKLTFILR